MVRGRSSIGLAKAIKILIRLVDGAALARIPRHTGDNVGRLLNHLACQHVRHALVRMADLAPDLHSRDLPRLGDPLAVVVVDCTLEDIGDLVVLQDAMQLGARGRLLLPMLKNRDV